MFSSPTIKKVILFIAIIAFCGLVAWSLFRVFQGVPFFGESEPDVQKEPKKIGIIHLRQQAEAVKGVKDGMAELGYSNVSYEVREISLGPNMTVDTEREVKRLIEEGVDLFYAPLELQAKPAIDVTKKMGSDIPVVFLTNFHDPVEYGLANSFKSSGNNATGISLDIVSVVQKHLEFMKKINPDFKKIGVFSEGFMVTGPAVGDIFLKELKHQAPNFGATVVEYKTNVPPPDAEKAFYEIADNIKLGDIDVVYHIAGHYFNYQETTEDILAIRLGIPMFAPTEDLPNGGQIGYSGDFTAAGKQSAKIIDKIFRGAKPSDIPLEYLEKVDLVIHPARIHVAGVELPESILDIVDRKIGE